jgi:hypothetical protein
MCLAEFLIILPAHLVVFLLQKVDTLIIGLGDTAINIRWKPQFEVLWVLARHFPRFRRDRGLDRPNDVE